MEEEKKYIKHYSLQLQETPSIQDQSPPIYSSAIIDDSRCINCGSITNEDLRKWFGKGGAGGTTKGGWDRYGSDGQKLGKCGGGKEGGAYAACLSAEKARKLGPKGRASFVRRKRAAQKKGGDAKKGKQRSKGKKPTYTKTGA